MADYYSTLGVSKNASADEIKKAFRKLAHQHHPDKPGGNEKKFKEINEAYQALSNPEKRAQYDQFGQTFDQARRQGGGGAGGGFNWQDFSGQGSAYGGASGFGGQGFDFSDLGDIFGNIFGGGRTRKGGSRRGRDIETEMAIDFREAVFGAEKIVELYKTVVCPHCHGNGAEPGTKINTCPTCGGSGQVSRVQRTMLGNFQTVATCPDCGGEGKRAEKKCGQCGGAGQVKELRKIKIGVPAGIDDGQAIKISGEGEAGAKGGTAGDLYISFRVKPDKEFRRRGRDILSKAAISFPLAALGGKMKVSTLDGPVMLKIPAGTQPGTVFKLKGKGVPRSPRLGGGNRGDQFVEIAVKVPEKLTKKQKETIKLLAEEGE